MKPSFVSVLVSNNRLVIALLPDEIPFLSWTVSRTLHTLIPFSRGLWRSIHVGRASFLNESLPDNFVCIAYLKMSYDNGSTD